MNKETSNENIIANNEITKGLLRNKYKRLKGVLPLSCELIREPINFENKSHVLGNCERAEVTLKIDDPESIAFFGKLFSNLFTKNRYIDMLIELKENEDYENDI
jgi:hypothetical protein